MTSATRLAGVRARLLRGPGSGRPRTRQVVEAGGGGDAGDNRDRAAVAEGVRNGGADDAAEGGAAVAPEAVDADDRARATRGDGVRHGSDQRPVDERRAGAEQHRGDGGCRLRTSPRLPGPRPPRSARRAGGAHRPDLQRRRTRGGTRSTLRCGRRRNGRGRAASLIVLLGRLRYPSRRPREEPQVVRKLTIILLASTATFCAACGSSDKPAPTTRASVSAQG